MKKYMFKSNLFLDYNRIHYFVNSQIERDVRKERSDYKVKFFGTFLEIYTTRDLLDTYKFDSWCLKRISVEDFQSKEYAEGEEVTITSLICYGLTQAKNKSVCPIRYSKVFNEEAFQSFEAKLGIKILRETLKVHHHVPEQINEKILLKDVFSLEAKVKILDAQKFNTLQTGNIGLRKSYGLGWVDVF